jgi:hypothetical protein
MCTLRLHTSVKVTIDGSVAIRLLDRLSCCLTRAPPLLKSLRRNNQEGDANQRGQERELMKVVGPKSLIAVLLMLVVGVTFRAATAHADDCLAAPNSPAREGTRWSYRLDRATQHKCWYMRALDQPAEQVAAQAVAPFAIPLPRPRPAAANSAVSLSPVDADPPSSHAEGFTAKQSAERLVSGSTDETMASIPTAPASPQAPASSAVPEPSAMPLVGAATAETASAISEIHQMVTLPETNAEATTPAPDAETLTGPTTDDITPAQQQAASKSNAQVAASGPTAPAQIIASIDDTASSIPREPAALLRSSSEARSDAAEPAPKVSKADTHAPLAAAAVNARPIQPDAPDNSVSDGRESTPLSDEPTDDAGMIRPFYLILAFGMALVGILHYLVFRFFPGGSRRISIDYSDGDCTIDDDPYNNPEFYRKLRQGVVLEQEKTSGEFESSLIMP